LRLAQRRTGPKEEEMKDPGTLLMKKEPFEEVLMGNTALVRAMVEAGTDVVTSYPGSPTPEIAAAILSIPREVRPFYFEFSVNEKVATEIALGASVNGHLSTVFFKSVGLNVAADTFVQLPLLELIGGMVIVLGDDPGANSSQNEQDNRHYARMSYTPMFEPGDPGETYEMYLEAAALSRRLHMPVILRLSTHICHAKAKVRFGTYAPGKADRSPRFDPANGPYIPLTEAALRMKEKYLVKLEKVREYAETSPFNIGGGSGGGTGSRRGIITSGLPYYSLRDLLSRRSRETPDILKLAMTYPLARERLLEFCRNHEEVLVLEELDPILETELKALAFDEGLRLKIHGKAPGDSIIGEYTPDRVRKVLNIVWPDLLPDVETSEGTIPFIPDRPAQLCPGCGHRSAFHAVKKALSSKDITVADIGCHTLGALPPYEMGQILASMGHSTSTASGLSLFNSTRKVVAFLGDSTFFHAGLPGIVNAVYNRHNITLIIMENGTTAMTGHQKHPGTESISIRALLESMGIESVTETDTYNQKKLIELVRESIAIEGFSVVIARHPCMLKFVRDRRKRGVEVSSRAEIRQDICERIHDCVSVFACPSFVLEGDGSVGVHPDLCIGDGSCVQTCPVEAIELKGLKKDE
jgi:indolepyruvate ferredoxin oxidoreductase alpha subunit